jgi:hypothetical protein
MRKELAPSKGFGPLTDWLTASRSTGLSHDGIIMLTSLFRFNIVFKCSGFHREEYAVIVF